jgi:hypothetical protein
VRIKVFLDRDKPVSTTQAICSPIQSTWSLTVRCWADAPPTVAPSMHWEVGKSDGFHVQGNCEQADFPGTKTEHFWWAGDIALYILCRAIKKQVCAARTGYDTYHLVLPTRAVQSSNILKLDCPNGGRLQNISRCARKIDMLSTAVPNSSFIRQESAP